MVFSKQNNNVLVQVNFNELLTLIAFFLHCSSCNAKQTHNKLDESVTIASSDGYMLST